MGPWTGSGPILTGTCSTAAWTLFDLSTAYLWAPVIGCVEDKIDCCPSSFAFVTTTSTASSTSSATSSASSAHTSTSSDLASPTVITNITLHESSPDGAVRTVDTLNQPLVIVVEPRTVERRAVAGNGVIKCPEDYVSVGATGCCPLYVQYPYCRPPPFWPLSLTITQWHVRDPNPRPLDCLRQQTLGSFPCTRVLEYRPIIGQAHVYRDRRRLRRPVPDL